MFRRIRAVHNVRFHRTGLRRLRHPVAGNLALTFEALDLTADGLRITATLPNPALCPATG